MGHGLVDECEVGRTHKSGSAWRLGYGSERNEKVDRTLCHAQSERTQ